MGLRIGGITFGGLASGFPTQDIIDELLEFERRPINLLEQRKEGFEEQLGVLQDLNTRTLALRDAIRALDNMDLLGSGPSINEEFRRFAATSSDETLVTASADAFATPGTLVFEVQQLAAAERNLSSAYASNTDTVGTGTFSIQVGSGTPTVVTIDATNNTLDGFAGAINDANAGVTAFVLNDGTGGATPYRVVIVGDDSGADQALSFVNNVTGGGLSFTETQAAQNARVVLDPASPSALTIESATNSFGDVIRGLTFEARATSATPVTVTVDTDPDAMVQAVTDLVAAYNDVADLIEEQSQIDPTTSRGGPLIGDRTLTGLKTQLAGVLASAIGSGSVTTAGQIGLSLNREGRLELDEAEFRSQVAADLDAVSSFFSGTGSLTDQLRQVTDVYADPVAGSLIARINGATDSITDLDESIQAAEDRLEGLEERLVLQFAALERTIAGIRQQGDFLSQFLLSSLTSA